MTFKYNSLTDKYQNHVCSIMFKGDFDQLLDYLSLKKVEFEFIPPGLKGSTGVLKIGETEVICEYE